MVTPPPVQDPVTVEQMSKPTQWSIVGTKRMSRTGLQEQRTSNVTEQHLKLKERHQVFHTLVLSYTGENVNKYICGTPLRPS